MRGLRGWAGPVGRKAGDFRPDDRSQMAVEPAQQVNPVASTREQWLDQQPIPWASAATRRKQSCESWQGTDSAICEP